MSPSQPIDGATRGFIAAIGGGEEKFDDPEILHRFVNLCGGEPARIAVIPTASELNDSGRHYEKLFRTIGANHVRVLGFYSRSDCENEKYLNYLAKADGAFMTGGNQLRLSTTLGGTPVAQLLRRRNMQGMHIAGTSAGAAFMPEHMIAGGIEGSTPRPELVTMAPGLGLTNRIVVDQHFRERDRLGRLLTALAYNPFAVGIGLDENTAAFIAPDDTLDVMGTGGLTIVDPSEIEFSSMDSAQRGEPVSLIGVRLHILVSGGHYDLVTREASHRAERKATT